MCPWWVEKWKNCKIWDFNFFYLTLKTIFKMFLKHFGKKNYFFSKINFLTKWWFFHHGPPTLSCHRFLGVGVPMVRRWNLKCGKDTSDGTVYGSDKLEKKIIYNLVSQFYRKTRVFPTVGFAYNGPTVFWVRCLKEVIQKFWIAPEVQENAVHRKNSLNFFLFFGQNLTFSLEKCVSVAMGVMGGGSLALPLFPWVPG